MNASIHYITLHCTALHCITLHYITLHIMIYCTHIQQSKPPWPVTKATCVPGFPLQWHTPENCECDVQRLSGQVFTEILPTKAPSHLENQWEKEQRLNQHWSGTPQQAGLSKAILQESNHLRGWKSMRLLLGRDKQVETKRKRQQTEHKQAPFNCPAAPRVSSSMPSSQRASFSVVGWTEHFAVPEPGVGLDWSMLPSDFCHWIARRNQVCVEWISGRNGSRRPYQTPVDHGALKGAMPGNVRSGHSMTGQHVVGFQVLIFAYIGYITLH